MYDSQTEDTRFYGLDGDKIGSTIEVFFITENIKDLKTYSVKITRSLEDIRDKVLANKGEIVFCAGDSILFTGNFDDYWCEEVLRQFQVSTGSTASIGIGLTITDAYLGLKLAKAKGGGKIAHYPAFAAEK